MFFELCDFFCSFFFVIVKSGLWYVFFSTIIFFFFSLFLSKLNLRGKWERLGILMRKSKKDRRIHWLCIELIGCIWKVGSVIILPDFLNIRLACFIFCFCFYTWTWSVFETFTKWRFIIPEGEDIHFCIKSNSPPKKGFQQKKKHHLWQS